jgi:hypothetical protein
VAGGGSSLLRLIANRLISFIKITSTSSSKKSVSLKKINEHINIYIHRRSLCLEKLHQVERDKK